jgi:hypothetical protein
MGQRWVKYRFPLDKWTNLNNARSNIDEPKFCSATNNATTGLHPAMSEMKNLHDNGINDCSRGVLSQSEFQSF